MKDIAKRCIRLGLDAASLTKKKAEEISKTMIRKSGISKKDAKRFVAKVANEADKQRKRLENFILEEAKDLEPVIIKAKKKGERIAKKVGSKVKKHSRKAIKRILE